MTRFLLFAAIGIILSSCATNYVYMNVQEPAPVTIPGYVKAVGILDRSVPTDKNELVNKIDQILSLEGQKLDKEGTTSCISALNSELSKNTRFTVVKTLPTSMKASGGGVFPAPIPWDSITRICEKNQLDALFVLEMFDSNTKISYAAVATTVSTPLGNVPGISHELSMLTNVRVGLRIYDAKGKNLLDEYTTGKSLTFGSKGINPVAAVNSLMSRKEAVKQAANDIGIEYAQSIIPFWVNVTRDYYVKGTDNFKTAKRRAQTGNWDGAAELWLKETQNPKAKVAGRACYNMAIINEINGNLEEAIKWAQQSYADYGNKLGLQYVNILKNRQAAMNKLNRQNADQ